MRKLILVTLLGTISIFNFKTSVAQTVTRGNVNTWGLLLNRFYLSEKFTITNELHERTGDLFQDQATFIFRPSIDYSLNSNIELSVGYSFVRSSPYTPYALPLARNEHNIWEQAMVKQKVGKVNIQHRFRFEHRFIDHIDAPTTPGGEFTLNGSDYANRFRYRFILSFDLAQFKNGEQALFFNGFDELWINQSDNMMPAAFARNWIYTGLGYRFNPDFNIQLAHVHQYDKTGPTNFISSSIIQLSVFKNFKLYSTPIHQLEIE